MGVPHAVMPVGLCVTLREAVTAAASSRCSQVTAHVRGCTRRPIASDDWEPHKGWEATGPGLPSKWISSEYARKAYSLPHARRAVSGAASQSC